MIWKTRRATYRLGVHKEKESTLDCGCHKLCSLFHRGFKKKFSRCSIDNNYLYEINFDIPVFSSLPFDASSCSPNWPYMIYFQGLNKEEVIQNCFAFLLAGYETTSTALTYASYLMGRYPAVQERLRQEILETKKTQVTNISISMTIFFVNIASFGLFSRAFWGTGSNAVCGLQSENEAK